MTERFHQQTDILDPKLLEDAIFLVVGAGAIGSFFVTTLAKMGAKKIHIWDDDKIEDHNIANQLFPEYMVGQTKVQSLAEMAEMFSGEKITVYPTRFDLAKKNTLTPNVYLISAVDNMDVRKELFTWAKVNNIKYFIDGRMGGLVLRCYSIDMTNENEVKFYEKTLYSQAKARPERCTAKSIIFTVLLVTGFMLDMVKKRLNGEKCPKEVIYDSNSSYHCCSIGTPVEEPEEALV